MDIKDYYQSASYLHKDKINSFTDELYEITETKKITIGISMPNGCSEILSTCLEELKYYYEQNMEQKNSFLKGLLFYDYENIITDKKGISQAFNKYTNEIKKKFNIYRTLCIQKGCYDCSVIVILLHHKKIKQPYVFYKNIRVHLLQFVHHFLDETLDIYAESLPDLKLKHFYRSSTYRQSVIMNIKPTTEFNLSDTQLEYLYLVSIGKTSDELATIFHVSRNTVQNHKKNIIEKMHASNINHAIYLGIKNNLL